MLNNSVSLSHSPISCSNCRKAHRKCDKLLPSCSECTQREANGPCYYHTPKKRGPKQNVLKKRKTEDQFEFSKVLVASTMESQNNTTTARVIIKTQGTIPATNSFQQNNFIPQQPFEQIQPIKNPSQLINHPQQVQSMHLQQQQQHIFITDALRRMPGIDQLTYQKYTVFLIEIYYEWVSLGFPLIDRQTSDVFLQTHFPYLTPRVDLLSPMSISEEARLAHLESMQLVYVFFLPLY
jgi:hypothetical protein